MAMDFHSRGTATQAQAAARGTDFRGYGNPQPGARVRQIGNIDNSFGMYRARRREFRWAEVGLLLAEYRLGILHKCEWEF